MSLRRSAWLGRKVRKWRPVLVATVVSVASGACALAPPYVRPAAPVQATYPAGPAYKVPSRATPLLPAAVDTGWRDFLGDARLNRLVEIGLANNRDLRIAVLKIAQSRAQYQVQSASSMPQIDENGNVARSRTPAAVSTTGHSVQARAVEIGLSGTWELDFFGRLANLSEAARQQYLATAQARKAAEILLVAQISDQYLTLLGDQELVAVSERTLATAQDSYQLTLLQFNTGTGTELAVSEAQTVYESALAIHAAQVRATAQAENALVQLLGQPLPADLPPPVSLDSQQILADIPEDLPSSLLDRRPDIMQAEAALRAANANIGAARAAFFPAISLTGELGNASPALGGLFQSGSKAWSFAPAISVPIFHGGALQANLEVARVEQEINVAAYEKVVQAAFREVADGLAARGTYDDQVAALERYTRAQQRRLDLSRLRFQNGVDPYLSVLTAQTDLYNAQQSLVGARVARLVNRVDLYRALGGGWVARTGNPPRIAQEAPTAVRPAAGPETAMSDGSRGATASQ